MDIWRFLPYEAHAPAMNMAIDEAILHLHREGKVPPTIRFYGWTQPTLSIGYFQKARKEIDFDTLQNKGFGFVRRMTGGRAVLHDQELTYSVIVEEAHPMMPKTVSESYRVISQGLLAGFKRLGLDASLAPPKGRTGEMSSACFDSPSDYELVVSGRKIAGSAQTRQKGIILQHGSILLDMDVEALFEVLLFPSDRVREKLKQAFTDKAVAIRQLADREIGLEEVKQAFFEGFGEGMGIQLQTGELTNQEKELAQRLMTTRYANDDWNFMR
ncbi:lipoate--protein ligase family protein [Laceyella sacchari]|jgi:lipoyl(octanoyl) transferase|uniref:Lipoate--protein ligase family protein n=1 Tax=Laceyella sacchari TaxID=37482 RepID=A0ABY5U537_LACSH|nr:lipoate--protein ligase family protein [Laceyella sacchari]TCW41168.1 lipoate-protein ligase A [Laceyella sacchari]UWE04753.1 lipoate--protein ligase family protein [Laceyella sacchari]